MSAVGHRVRAEHLSVFKGRSLWFWYLSRLELAVSGWNMKFLIFLEYSMPIGVNEGGMHLKCLLSLRSIISWNFKWFCGITTNWWENGNQIIRSNESRFKVHSGEGTFNRHSRFRFICIFLHFPPFEPKNFKLIPYEKHWILNNDVWVWT